MPVYAIAADGIKQPHKNIFEIETITAVLKCIHINGAVTFGVIITPNVIAENQYNSLQSACRQLCLRVDKLCQTAVKLIKRGSVRIKR